MFSFNGLSLKKNADLVGVDIGSSCVKVVQLKQVGKLYQLESYAITPLSKGAVNNGAIEKIPEVIGALERSLKRAGISAKLAAIALPASTVTSRDISFPGDLSDFAIYEQIESEANLHIPYPLDDARFDFCVLPSESEEATAADSKSGNQSKFNKGVKTKNADDVQADIDVMMMCAKRDLVDARVNVLEAANLKPKCVDVESYCIQRAVAQCAQSLPKKGKGLVLAHLDIGAVNTTLTVCKDDEILFQRTQSFGGQQLTSDIARQFELSLEEAELKKRSSDLPPEYVQKVLKSYLQDASQIASRQLQLFYSSTQYGRADQLYVAGGSAVIPGLVDSVLHATQVPTVLFKPQAAFAANPRLNRRQLEQDAPGLSTAFGLAMRAFDR